MPYIHNINPVLFDLGPVEIRYYGLIYVLGFAILFFWFKHLINTKELKLTQDELYDFVFYIMIGVIVGSRLVHAIFWDPVHFIMRPWELLFLWKGGMAFHGGILGVAVATWLYWRKPSIKKKVKFTQLGDALAMPAILMFALGRLANFINAELPGTVTNVKWCVIFPQYDDMCRHPQVLYSSAKRFLIFGWMVFLRGAKGLKDGFIFLNMLLLTGIGRFAIDFYRMDSRWLGLTAGQYLSVVMVLIAGWILFKHYGKEWKKIF